MRPLGGPPLQSPTLATPQWSSSISSWMFTSDVLALNDEVLILELVHLSKYYSAPQSQLCKRLYTVIHKKVAVHM